MMGFSEGETDCAALGEYRAGSRDRELRVASNEWHGTLPSRAAVIFRALKPWPCAQPAEINPAQIKVESRKRKLPENISEVELRNGECTQTYYHDSKVPTIYTLSSRSG
jgi:hypothetical protein